jgi:hypothetical protein
MEVHLFSDVCEIELQSGHEFVQNNANTERITFRSSQRGPHCLKKERVMNFDEILRRFDANQLIGLAAVIGGLLVAMISVIATQWRRVRIAQLETNLKRQMLEKGMPLAQVEQVMKAHRESTDGGPCLTGNENADKAALVQRMVDNGYEGEDIERVLKAYQPAAKPTPDIAVRNP